MECVGRGIFSVKKVGVEDDENDAQSQKVCKGEKEEKVKRRR